MVTFKEIESKKAVVSVVGLGYVGLPLAVALGKKIKVIGFDISDSRIQKLKKHQDPSEELTVDELKNTTVDYTSDPARIKEAKFIIVAVPTPIDTAKIPDLSLVLSACELIGKNLCKGSVIVFESTVYPGVTEEICGPALEKHSGLKCGIDFKLGYSPERINPGDREHTLESIVKVVSGEDDDTLELAADVYGLVVAAGVHKASSIKVAEAAKVIENTQRDLNIALMNELSIIFNRMGIDTKEVLEAAGTKWNFLKFSPGLVGGHCIGVDPYYLTHKANELGYKAEIILAGRHINDNMGKHVAENTVKLMIHSDVAIKGSRVAVLGLTFKENVADIRNTKVIDIINELKSFGVEVIVSDPYADPEHTRKEYGVELTPGNDIKNVNAVIFATPHEAFREYTPEKILSIHKNKENAIAVDVKRILDRREIEKENISYWGL